MAEQAQSASSGSRFNLLNVTKLSHKCFNENEGFALMLRIRARDCSYGKIGCGGSSSFSLRIWLGRLGHF